MQLKNQPTTRSIILTLSLTFALALTKPAFAHHPLGGKLPANFFEGIISGFGHPIVGLDHLVFVIASGLIALKTTTS